MKPVDFHEECPKCGGGTPFINQHYYCWHNSSCPTWRTYGGEHLHRTCSDCKYIFVVLTKDFSNQEQVDDEWLSKKVDEVIGPQDSDDDEFIVLLDEIEWDSSERPDLP